MQIENLREGGPYEIETFSELKPITGPNTYGGFEIAACAVVYGDKGNPSHSIRLFKVKED